MCYESGTVPCKQLILGTYYMYSYTLSFHCINSNGIIWSLRLEYDCIVVDLLDWLFLCYCFVLNKSLSFLHK